MSLSGSRSRLAAVAKELSLRWMDTKSSWSDSKAQEFEQRYMQDLLARLDKTVGVVEKLDQLLSKVKSDCE
ncbi:MAG TPA: hypothetical protein VLT36_22130 [Candidatus Dormibacteraeota bacterium]|nr:hypothetical protein [Candidatus Dormibacteraeota bacterium]